MVTKLDMDGHKTIESPGREVLVWNPVPHKCMCTRTADELYV